MSYVIISKFIKDVSFEIPNAQAFATLERDIAKYSLHFEIKSKPFKNNIIEVNTILKMLPSSEIKNKMLTEINLAALVSVEDKVKDRKELEKIILIKVPAEVYPILYDTFIFLFSQAGIKNINIQKEVDFEKLYNEKMKN